MSGRGTFPMEIALVLPEDEVVRRVV